jgi:membrane protease subunit (stomatin/prohibitin family)
LKKLLKWKEINKVLTLYNVDNISEDLEEKLEVLLSKIRNQSDEEILKLRMNELALSKVPSFLFRF